MTRPLDPVRAAALRPPMPWLQILLAVLIVGAVIYLMTDYLLHILDTLPYLGVVLMMNLHLFLVQWPTLLTLVMFPVLVIVYFRLARREDLMNPELGGAYAAHPRQVRGVFPRVGHNRADTGPKLQGRS